MPALLAFYLDFGFHNKDNAENKPNSHSREDRQNHALHKISQEYLTINP